MPFNKIFLSLIFFVFLISSCSSTKNLTGVSSKKPLLLEEIDVIGSRSFKEYKATEKRDFDLLHTKIEISFDWENKFALGKATLKLKPYFYAQDELILDAKGFDIKRLGLLNNGSFTSLSYNYSDSLRLIIDLGRTYDRNEILEIEIEYVAKPDELVRNDEASFGNNKGLYFINADEKNPYKPRQIWTQGETESSSCWFPTIDIPNEKTTSEIIVTVEDKFVTFSNGLLLSSVKNGDGTRTDHWKQKLPHAPYLVALAAGEYAIVNDQWRDIEVDYYVEPKYEKYAHLIFGNTPEMLEFYSQKFRVDYPWEKYHQIVVRDFVAGAMENTSATIHYDGLHKDNRELLYSDNEDIIAHEIMHQWFGDLVTCESWSNLPLNESFATYGEYLWFEYKYGRTFADMYGNDDLRGYLSEASGSQKKMIRYYYDNADDMFDAHSYQKGGRILHMLRYYVGDDAFFDALNYYLTSYAYETAEIHDLRLTFEKITGEDLNWFFNQWFFVEGHPILDVNYVSNDSTVTLTIEQESSFNKGILYRLPFEIDIHTADGVIRKSIVVDEKKNSYTFPITSELNLLSIDAHKTLLGTKTESKPKEHWIYQYNKGKLYMDQHEALAHMFKNQADPDFQKIMLKALDNPFWGIRELVCEFIDWDEFKSDDLVQKLRDLAVNDEKAKVRNASLELLSELNDEANTELFLQAMNDSSYRVIATALSAIEDNAELNPIQYVENLQLSNDGYLINAVASIIAKYGTENHVEFFETNMAKSDSYTKYYLIYNYGDFLERMNSDIVKSGISKLETISNESSSPWTKAACKDVLQTLDESFASRKSEAEKKLKKKGSLGKDILADINTEIRQADDIIQLIQTTLETIDKQPKSNEHF